MRSTILLPDDKQGKICRTNKIIKRPSSFSSIELDADSNLKGTKIHSLGYKINAKKIWENL